MADRVRDIGLTYRDRTIYFKLPDFLREFQTDISIDPEALARTYWNVVSSEAEELLAKNGFQLGERIKLDRHVFLTEKPIPIIESFLLLYFFSRTDFR